MVKVLTNLRIDEVSAVDKGAGRNVKIVLMKRASEPDATPMDTLKAFPNSTSFNAVLARMEAEAMAKAMADDRDADRDAGSGGAGEHALSRLADLAVESQKFSSRAEALNWLISHPNGHAFARLHKAAETAKETPPMDTILSIMKSAGIGATCAAIVAKGSTTISQDEMVAAVSKIAHERWPELTEAQAFDKVFSDRGEEGRALRQAINVAKAMPVTPTMVGGVDATHEAIDSTESSEAYEQLTRMAEKMREASPELSAAQAFDRVFTDKRNASLAAKAHRRPTAPVGGAYPFPR